MLKSMMAEKAQAVLVYTSFISILFLQPGARIILASVVVSRFRQFLEAH